jgi:hypothetical protein
MERGGEGVGERQDGERRRGSGERGLRGGKGG